MIIRNHFGKISKGYFPKIHQGKVKPPVPLIPEFNHVVSKFFDVHSFGEDPTGSCYNNFMENKRVSETNPYLRDKAKRKTGLFMSVCSSSAIEGIAAEDFLKEYLSRKARQTTSHKISKSGQRHS